MEFRTSFQVARSRRCKSTATKTNPTKVFNYIRAEHIKRIFEESSLEILTPTLSSLFSSLFLPFSRLPTNSIRSEFGG